MFTASTGAAGRALPAPGLRSVAVLGWALVALLPSPPPVVGQDLRGWAGTTVQAVDLRPFSTSSQGCPDRSSCLVRGDDVTSVVGTQDLNLTAWGFGVQGLSARLYLRARTGFGSDSPWPRSGDRFDALLGYGQLVRSGWTVRLGRQEIRSGLGFSSFDGASVAWRNRRIQIEAYGGRSLARGLRDPANDALRGLEDFLPDQSVSLWGGSVGGRFGNGSARVRYQREILSDRSGLASERASLDATATLPRVRLSGSADWDFGLDRPGKGHLTASVPLGDGRWMVSATARRYVPYFSLSTIWGFFEPVAYHEMTARVAWSPSAEVGMWGAGGRRSYGDAGVVTVLQPLEDTGWRGELGALWLVSPSWRLDGRYGLEWVPGGFLSSADASLRWTVTPAISVALSGMSFQQIEEFRLGDGRAYGTGVNLNVGVTDRIDLAGGASVLRHTTEGDRGDGPWNQSRAWVDVRVRLGDDPGLANRAHGGLRR